MWVHLVHHNILRLPFASQAMASSLDPEHFNLSFHFFQHLVKDQLTAESKCKLDKKISQLLVEIM